MATSEYYDHEPCCGHEAMDAGHCSDCMDTGHTHPPETPQHEHVSDLPHADHEHEFEGFEGFEAHIKSLPEHVQRGMQEFIKSRLDPENRARLMLEYDIPKEMLDGLEILAQDDYPWVTGVKMVRGMMALAEKPGMPSVVDQCKHFVALRQALLG